VTITETTNHCIEKFLVQPIVPERLLAANLLPARLIPLSPTCGVGTVCLVESPFFGVHGLMLRFLIATAMVWFVVPSWGIAQVEFRWKFRPGDTRNVEMTQQIVHEFNGKRTETKQTLWLRWHVQSADEHGIAQVEQSVRRLSMAMNEQLLIDTDDPEPQEEDTPIASRLRSLMRVRFVAQTTPLGEIGMVQFEPEILDRLRDQLGLNETAVRQTFAQESLRFPDRPLDVGATWSSTATSTIEGLGEIETTTTYQYVGDETNDGRTLSRFKITPAFQLNETARALAWQEGDSTLWFDRERGLLVRVISHQVFELKKKEAAGDSVQKNDVKTTVEFTDSE
jgi:hypothetical protein